MKLITGNTTKFTQEGAQSREPLHLDLVSAENVGARAPCSPMPQLLQYFPCTLGWTDLFVATLFDRDIPWPLFCVPSGTGVIRLNLWSAKENSNLLTMCGRRTCSHSIHQLLERASLPGQLYSILKCKNQVMKKCNKARLYIALKWLVSCSNGTELDFWSFSEITTCRARQGPALAASSSDPGDATGSGPGTGQLSGVPQVFQSLLP